ncbi:MAG TPA: helix-turn-helix domain-containing protein, partial [Ktedonobacteraceae bacterium]
VVDLDLIWGDGVKTLEEQLFDDPSPQNTLEILNRALLERFEDIPHLRVIQAAVQTIDALGGNISIDTLADQLGWSQKQLERLFAQYIGFLPKRYARISRFQHLSRWTARHPHDRKIGKLAADFGYFDQSHLIKEFTTFTGVPPQTFFSTMNHIVEYVYAEPLLSDLSV